MPKKAATYDSQYNILTIYTTALHSPPPTTRKLKVTMIMYNRQVLSSHRENALEVVRNINQADECKSCQHKTITSKQDKLLHSQYS